MPCGHGSATNKSTAEQGMENTIEDNRPARVIDETEDNEILTVLEAKKYYRTLAKSSK
jgi:hypothetical protein